MIIILDEEYRRVGHIDPDSGNGTGYIRLETMDEILGDISDELWTITRKLEQFSKISKSLGCPINIEPIIDNLQNTLDENKNYNWKTIMEKITNFVENQN
jgi:hypothetical protein